MKLVKVLSTVALLCLASTVMALDLVPYVGVDAHWRVMNSNSKTRAGVFGSNSPQPLFYAGLVFNDCLALEAGNFNYKHNAKKHKMKHTVKGSYLAAIYKAYIFQDQNVVLLGGMGFTTVEKIDAIKDKKKEINIKTKISNSVPRVLAGLEYKLSEHVAIRGVVVWENATFYQKSTNPLIGNDRKGDDYSGTIGLNYSF